MNLHATTNIVGPGCVPDDEQTRDIESGFERQREIIRPQPRRQKRKGSLLVELTVAMAITATLLVGSVKVIAFAATQSRLAAQRQAATQEVANLMEHAFAVPWSELSANALLAVNRSEWCQRELPGLRMEVDVTRQETPATAKQVVIRATWGRHHTESLTGWRYRDAALDPQQQPRANRDA